MAPRDGPPVDHWELSLLWGARRTGVLDALTTTAGTPEAVAAASRVDAETAARFVRLLTEYGYLRRVGEEYEPTNRALGFLTTRDVRSIGATPRALDRLDAMAALGGGTGEDGGSDHGGRPPGDDARGGADGEPRRTLHHRLGAHAATPTETVRAGVTAAVHAAPDADRVVDVRGASGVYAAEFVRRGRSATLVESEAALDAVGAMRAGEGVETVAADDVTSVPVADADLALLAGVLRRHPPATNRELLRSVADALRPGGTVVVLEPLRDRSPGTARRVAVERLAAGAGDACDEATVGEWLSAAGFGPPETHDVPGSGAAAVVARTERGVD
jgi:SAM-dependent methyltransferase